MVGFEMGAIITVVAILSGLCREWIKRNQNPPVDLSGIEKRLDQLEALQERIVVLEAIVTDKGYDLKKEIDSLK